ncbi:MAG: tRNA lysidine(34) synthetase TilS [Actinomycetota bacterium]|nr:tRNA lysidine(34) synthetase TilS [Actinomycetota bacterium]
MVSGGPDSVAMLRVLVGFGARPLVLHIDHGLRGEESREDAEFVRELCESLGVLCEVRRIALDPGGGNLQEKAREERYRAAHELADERGLSVIFVGHTADDVAETVLMNLARGAGLRGLSGIPPVRGRIARPLIERHRIEVLGYLKSLGQPYRTDPTNLTLKYARNRIRQQVLPILEELYPGTAGNIARNATLLREDLEALESLAQQAISVRGEEVVIPLDDLDKMPTAVARYALRTAYSKVVPNALPLNSTAVEAILCMSRKAGRTRLHRPSRDVEIAVRPGSEVSFYKDRGAEPFPGEEEVREGEGRFDGWLVTAREVSRLDLFDAARPGVAYLDASKGPFRMRMAREGDTIRPLGLGGEKKVLRAMMDRKVPKDLRRRTPVVLDARGRVAWVFLGELGEEFKVTPATNRVLRIEVEKNS